MALERHAILVNFAKLAQRKHLKPAAVCQDGAIPAHEFVQPTAPCHQRIAGSQVEVIRVGQNHRRAHLAQVARRHTLHRGLRAHRHKRGRDQIAVRRVKNAASRAALFSGN